MDDRVLDFWGIDQTLDFQQKQTLACGIEQVVGTTPPNFKFFEFQFSGHQVYIYRLEHNIILLVLTTANLVYSTYVEVVKQLQRELQKDIVNTIATFRLLADSPTLFKQNYWQSTKAKAVPSQPKDAWVPPAPTAPVDCADSSSSAEVSKAESVLPESVPPSQPLSAVTLTDTIAALNQLNRFTAQYLGERSSQTTGKQPLRKFRGFSSFRSNALLKFVFLWLQAGLATLLSKCGMRMLMNDDQIVLDRYVAWFGEMSQD